MVWSYGKQDTTVPAFQQTLKGFDGEMTDVATGWQFLGNGHRTYNPSQRYFVSEDPVGDGYAFGSNNPIMNSDPSGNMPRWLGKMFKIASTVLTLGMNNVHSHFLQGIGRSLIWAGMGLPFGPTLAIGLAFAAPATLAFASALKPANKGLQQASMITGGIYAGALFVAGLLAIGAGIGTAVAGLIGALVNGGTELAEAATATAATVEGMVVEGAGNLVNEFPMQSLVDFTSSEESEAEYSFNAAAEEPPQVKRAVLQCGTYEPCYHRAQGVTTISDNPAKFADCYVRCITDYRSVESDMDGENNYDEILDEHRCGHTIFTARALLKPGGRLYLFEEKPSINQVNQDQTLGELYKYRTRVMNWSGFDCITNTAEVRKIAHNFGFALKDGRSFDSYQVWVFTN